MSGIRGAASNSTRIEIYGPSGLRRLLRTTLEITQARLNGKYVVHELLTSSDSPYPCDSHLLHPNENPGRDIFASEDGTWPNFENAEGLKIDAGPILHRITCLGYVFTEPPQASPVDSILHLEPLERNRAALAEAGITNPRSLLGPLLSTRQPVTLPDGYLLEPPPLSIHGRKIVILGDTCDPSGIEKLAQGASLLVHEATNAYIPSDSVCYVNGNGVNGVKCVSMKDGDSEAAVRAKAISRGHATPVMAGEFARKIGANRLFLNHFSAKFPPASRSARSRSPTSRHHLKRDEVVDTDPMTARVLQEIERQATEAWHEPGASGKAASAITAWDFLSVNILGHEVNNDSEAELGDIREVRRGSVSSEW
ncbi:hypothetical protein FRC02_009948 [Tulasnella sp. 418]|nr:hypothetical protein FRC02_009948 [Tulasnella sp. 418]